MDSMIKNDLQLALLNRTSHLENMKNTNHKTDDSLRKATDDFEAFFMQQLLDISMKNSTIAGEGTGSEIIKGLYTENLAKAGTGTLGISDMLYKFLSENKKN
jgi:Rod binding domain-containing protein